MKIIDRFEIPYYQYVDEVGELAADAPAMVKDTEALLSLYRKMVLVRMVDAKAIALQRTGKLGTYPSTRGQEAVFVGVGHAMEQKDIFVPYYRDMGILIQRGVPISQILLYWGGDERGNDLGENNFPFSVPVGSQPLHAAGAAYALKYRHEKHAVISMCGDGATSQGDFYEAMNVAGSWRLPVVFIVCNNQWAISVSREAQTAAHTLAQKALAAGFNGEQVDGNDIVAVCHRTKEALKNAREQSQPHLLEMLCYRQHDHTTADDASRYEPKNLRETEWKKEPILRLRHYLEKLAVWTAVQEDSLQADCAKEVDAAVKDYLQTPPQPLESVFDYLYATLPKAYQVQRELFIGAGILMTDITLVEAINQALAYEMQADHEVIVIGEDVGKDGGVFRATLGLLDRFGPERVLDTPLAESMIAGLAIGMAARGLKPVAEFQFMGFIYPALDQIVNHAARMRNRTRGRMSCPVVFRTPFGAGIHAPEHHSESTEAYFAHTPGLRVVIPSSPARAYGLLLAAIRDPDPVLFLEPSRLYRFAKQAVNDDGKALPLDVCFTLRVGADVTLVTWGAMIKETLAVADTLAQTGIRAEVIDVATVKPLDMETILASVEKTGRCVVVHEAPLTCGVGAEIIAQVAEKALFSLKAPPERITGFDTIVPYARLEKYYIPSEKRIIDAVHRLMEFA